MNYQKLNQEDIKNSSIMRNEIKVIIKNHPRKKSLELLKSSTSFKNQHQCSSKYSIKYKGKQSFQTHSMKQNWTHPAKKENYS
jgi:hypothetical protein